MPDRSADILTLPKGKAARSVFLDPGATLIRMADVSAITGLARATIYKQLKSDPTFPRPVKLGNSGGRSAPVGFVLAEVQAWVRARIAARDDA